MASIESNVLDGRTLWIPRMTYIGASIMAASFRSIGIDAAMTPESNAETLELGGLYSSGEECYPEKVTLGNFLRIVKADGFDADRTAFFMPTAEGPCRFGQYSPYLRQVLEEMGCGDIPVISPTSDNHYAGLSDHGGSMVRRMWRGVVAGDILQKMLLKTRPYETQAGSADETLEQGLAILVRATEQPGLSNREHFATIKEALVEVRDLFRAVPARYTRDRPLIGMVGEIFCRLNTFSNRDAARQVEAHGGEVWLSDVSEWIMYTAWSQKNTLKRLGRRFSRRMLGAWIAGVFQLRDMHEFLAPFAEDFVGYEEPHDVYRDVLKGGWPYLPADQALGEMALSVGKVVYLHGKGADGIIDISPFSCMNGIVSEAVYHAIAKDHDDIPIRNFYFDATSSNMQRDLDIFMELAGRYRSQKRNVRRYPAYFEQ